MSDESTESSAQDDSTVRPPAAVQTELVDPLEGDPYELGSEVEDEPPPAVEEPSAEETPPAEETRTEEPEETVESLQAKYKALEEEKDRLFRAQQSHYEDNKLLRRQVALLELEQREADLEEEEDYEEPEEVPDPVVDPVGAAAYKADQARIAAERVEEKIDRRATEDERKAFVKEVGEWAGAQHKEFVETHPDYDAAAAVVRDRIIVEPMRAMGRSDAEIAAAADKFTTAKILQARQEGKNPSAEIYEMAKGFGYTPADPTNGDKPETPATPAPKSPVQIAAEKAKGATTLAAAPGSSGHKTDSGSIAMILKDAERDDPLGEKVQAAHNMIIDNVKRQLGRGATDDDAQEAIDSGLIKRLQ